jgi:hypothetical protein
MFLKMNVAIVIPAQAGTFLIEGNPFELLIPFWIPACAGMTVGRRYIPKNGFDGYNFIRGNKSLI